MNLDLEVRERALAAEARSVSAVAAEAGLSWRLPVLERGRREYPDHAQVRGAMITATEQRRERLTDAIWEFFKASDYTYGSPRVVLDLGTPGRKSA